MMAATRSAGTSIRPTHCVIGRIRSSRTECLLSTPKNCLRYAMALGSPGPCVSAAGSLCGQRQSILHRDTHPPARCSVVDAAGPDWRDTEESDHCYYTPCQSNWRNPAGLTVFVTQRQNHLCYRRLRMGSEPERFGFSHKQPKCCCICGRNWSGNRNNS